MFAVVITEKGGAQRRLEFDKGEVTIGRVQGNDIILPKGNVSKRHSRIVLKDNRFIVVDLKSTNGTYVNGRKITSPLVVKAGDKIYIGDFILTLEEGAGAGAGAPALPAPAPSPDPAPAPRVGSPSSTGGAPPPLPRGPEPAPPVQSAPPAPQPPQPQPQPAPAPPPPQPTPPQPAPAPYEEPPTAAPQPAPRISPRSESPPRPESSRAPSVPGSAPAISAGPPTGGQAVLAAVVAHAAGSFDVREVTHPLPPGDGRRDKAKRAVDTAMDAVSRQGSRVERAQLGPAAIEELCGLGALTGLIQDTSAQEVVVQGPNKVLVDRGAGLAPHEAYFSSAEALSWIVGRLVRISGGHFDQNRAMHEGTVPGGLHFSAVLPPISVGGPLIELRRTQRPAVNGDQLVAQGLLSNEIFSTLERALQSKRNIVVVGGHDAGVGQLLSALANLAAHQERLLTIEDSPSLALQSPDAVRLAAGPGASMQAIIAQGGRMRADRLVIDGVRGPDTLSALLQLSSRSGCMLGVHSSAPENVLEHLTALARLDGIQEDAVRRLVPSAVQVLVHLSRGHDGRGRVESLSEVRSDGNGGAQIVELFGGNFTPTGQAPSF